MIKHPLVRKRASSTSEPQNQEYWLSYSDLLAGLLMVFVLMLLVATTAYNRSRAEIDRTREQATAILETMRVREELIGDLEGVDNPDIVVDTVTAAVSMRDAVLFGEGSAVLREAGRNLIQRFASDYLPIIMDNDLYTDHLEEVVIEGHTNDNGSYMYNMVLSQDRAQAVLTHLFSVTQDPEMTEFLERYLTARGRSFSDVICLDGTTGYAADCGEEGVDKEASRRIEIRFGLDDEEVVRQVMETLDDTVSTIGR